MTDIEKIREGLYVKKGFDGLRVVHPIKNDDGSWNWFNVFTGGTWWKLTKLLLILTLVLGMSWSYMRDTQQCRDLLSDPCKILSNLTAYCNQENYDFLPYGESDFNLGGAEINE